MVLSDYKNLLKSDFSKTQKSEECPVIFLSRADSIYRGGGAGRTISIRGRIELEWTKQFFCPLPLKYPAPGA